MAKALIVYFSKSGHTRKMAEIIAEGIEAAGVEAILTDTAHANLDDLPKVDAIVLGSPTYYGSMAAEMKEYLDKSVKYHGKLAGKIGGAFSSSGMLGGGNETTVLNIIHALLIHGMLVQGSAKISHYGPVAVGVPNEQAIKECMAYGKKIGEMAIKLGQ